MEELKTMYKVKKFHWDETKGLISESSWITCEEDVKKLTKGYKFDEGNYICAFYVRKNSPYYYQVCKSLVTSKAYWETTEPETTEQETTEKAKILTYDEYDAKCHYIAGNLFNNDCNINYIPISELTEMIINELPDNYFIDTTETLHDEFSKAFTLSEFVDKVSVYLDEMYKVWDYPKTDHETANHRKTTSVIWRA